MDHAFYMRAPQAGPPPSSDWSLSKISSSEPPSGLAQYHVLDAVGVRLGPVSGWVRSPDGEVVGLCVGLRGFFNEQIYLIPIGYVTQINPRHQVLHLRELTRRTLPQTAVRCDDVLPPAEVLETVFREAPLPRPEIQGLLQAPETGPSYSHAPALRPAATPAATGKRAGSPTPPLWRPLAEFAAEEDMPYWL